MTRHNLVLGLGLSGQSACRFLRRRGEEVYAYDDRPIEGCLDKLRALGVRVVTSFPDGIERMVVSPGVPPTHPFYQTAQKGGIPVLGEIELGLQELKGVVIGITGSNGKTTTTCLIEHVLVHLGFEALAMGNVGLPITDAVERVGEQGIAVVELSSFQLETMSKRTLDYAIFLNLTSDHLDRYQTLDKYAQAKWRIADCLREGGTLIKSIQLPDRCPLSKTLTFGVGQEADCWTDGSHLWFKGKLEGFVGSHYGELISRQRENFMAAYVVCRCLGIELTSFFQAAMSFERPPHRMEFLGHLRGIAFVNDSKGTNTAAVQHALAMVDGPILLIAGGRSKGSNFIGWIPWLPKRVQKIFAIGEAGPQIAQELGSDFPVKLCQGLEDAVHSAYAEATSGDTVLLSPGCSSLDAYQNFEQRGAHFRSIVFNLIRQHSNA